MQGTLQEVLIFVLIPVAATIVGAIAPAFYTPSPSMGSAIQHFSAGVVFAAGASRSVDHHRTFGCGT